jgi:hypothetical protein
MTIKFHIQVPMFLVKTDPETMGLALPEADDEFESPDSWPRGSHDGKALPREWVSFVAGVLMITNHDYH